MGARGPAPRPKLEVVRDGNPGHKTRRKLDEQFALPPSSPTMPDWKQWWPDVRGDRALTAEHRLARAEATREWNAIVPPLDAVGRLASVDRTVLTDHCVVVARLLLAERDISAHGIAVPGKQGMVKNLAVTAANQYRTQLRFTVVQLGLSPAARARSSQLEGSRGAEEDSPFDV